MDHPPFLPGRLGQGQPGAVLGERGLELAPHELGQSGVGEQKAGTLRQPLETGNGCAFPPKFSQNVTGIA